MEVHSNRLVRLIRKGSLWSPFFRIGIINMIQLLRSRKVRIFLFVFFIILGFTINYFKYQRILPNQFLDIVELIKNR